MRKFIISDLHGVEEAYFTIISFLNNINKDEEVVLYINGDLIDRGKASHLMLYDVLNVIDKNNDNNIKIVYLCGNHEHMMYRYFNDIELDYMIPNRDWFLTCNGGTETYNNFKNNGYKYQDFIDLKNKIKYLPVYHLFDEEINGKKIVLVHAKCPNKVNKECSLLTKDINITNLSYIWAREDDGILFTNYLGNKNYFTIKGHTVVKNKLGFSFDYNNQILNIDGGCSYFACGYTDFTHVPLVEVFDEHINILTFNMKNSIISAISYDGNNLVDLTNIELDNYRKYLDVNPYARKRKIEEEIKIK